MLRTQWTRTGLLALMVVMGAALSAADEPIHQFVSFNERLVPGEGSEIFFIPKGMVLIVTDIVIQNRSIGDEPVTPTAFSRVVVGPGISAPSNIGPGDVFLTVVGNDTLNLHFTTGRVVEERFRVFNVGNSTALQFEFLVNGFLTKQPH